MKKKKYIKNNKSKAKVIQFPTDYNPKTIPDDYDDNYMDEYDDFEDWETLVELKDNEDYPGLVEYCKKKAERDPDDPYAQYYLGEAYVLNGEYERAIQFLSKHHKKIPYSTDYQYVILDALFALGKNEDDFEWTEKPIVLRMSREILDTCYEFLKPKKKPRTVVDLYMEFIAKGYLYFKEKDLYKALVEDNRFIVEKTTGIFTAEVRILRKKR